MRILFTGGSSFTGFWFIRELARAGHEVVATFRRRPEQYPDDVRRRRVSLALESCRAVFGCSFGDAEFVRLAGGERWDLLCHHAAEVTDYKSPGFDAVGALQNNARNVVAVLEALRAAGSARVLLTGSVFENDEGAGSEGLPAFSPYGLSKALTYQAFRYYAARAHVVLGKFVIPNPFGPYEDPRFTAYLMKTWFAGQTAEVNTPAYVRDNIHVSLLAKTYARFARELAGASAPQAVHPSGYPESQGAFAQRYAAEMRPRLGLACELRLKRQVDFQEPRVRINTELLDGDALGWDEKTAWDEVAAYYAAAYRKG